MSETNEQCLEISSLALSGTLTDVTEGADSYEVSGTNAYWSDGLTPVVTIGAHDFYITRKTP
jgi:hypothetical protein